MFVLTPEGLRGVIAPVVTAYGGGFSEELQWFDDQWEDVGGVYRTQSSVRSVVDFLGGHLSRIRLKVNGPDGWMADHDLQHLLDRPMADKPVGRIDFWLGMWNDMLIYDRAAAFKIRDQRTGRPFAMVRIPAQWWGPSGGNYIWPDSLTIQGNRSRVDVDIANCIYLHGYSDDPRLGSSPLVALRDILREDKALMAYRTRFWKSGAQPSMVVTRPMDAPDWTDEARDRFIEGLRSAQNSGRPLLLEESMQINAAAAFQPRTDEVSNSRQFSRAEVCRVFNLPVGILEEATASNLAQQRIGLYSETLRPLLDRIADSVTAQTLSDFDLDPGTHTVAFDLAEATRPPMPELIAAVAQGVREGFVTPAEGRDMLGLEKLGPEAKADKLRLAANINILGDTAAPANAPGPAGLPGKPLNPARDNAERQDRAQSQNAGKRWAFCEEHGRHYTDAEWRLCHTSE